jgi:hypothetical protein
MSVIPANSYDPDFVQNVFPAMAVPKQPVSSEKFIQAKRYRRFLPTQQTKYDGVSNQRVEFIIADSTDFISWGESYLQFDMKVAEDNKEPFLDIPGGHALIRRISVHSLAGALIAESDYYNLFSSIKSHLTESPEYVDKAKWIEGDSIGEVPQALALTVVSVDATGRVITVNADPEAIVAVGDLINIRGQQYRVTARANGPPRTVTVDRIASVSAGDVLYGPLKDISFRRREVCVGTQRICLKLDNEFLRMNQLFPLSLTKGIKVEITFEHPDIALISNGGAGAVSYEISNPLYFASMYSLSRELIDQYINLYQKDGIAFEFVQHQAFRHTEANATGAELYLSSNVRNASALLTVITDDKATTIGDTTKTARSLSTFRRSNLTSYEVSAGSHKFPAHAPVDMATDTAGVQAYLLARKALNVDNSYMLDRSRINSQEWGGLLSKKFVIGTSLTKLDGDIYSGQDLTNSQLQVKLTFSGQDAEATTRYITNYLMYTTSIVLSADGMVVKR